MRYFYKFATFGKSVVILCAMLFPFMAFSQVNKDSKCPFFEISIHGGLFSIGTDELFLAEEGLFYRHTDFGGIGPSYYGFLPFSDLDTAKAEHLMEYVCLNRIDEIKGFQYPEEWQPAVDRMPLIFYIHRKGDSSVCHFQYYYKHELVEELIELFMDILPQDIASDYRKNLNVPKRGFLFLPDNYADTTSIYVQKVKVIYDDTCQVRPRPAKTDDDHVLSLGDFVSVRITDSLADGSKKTLMLTLAGFLYQIKSADGSLQYHFIPYDEKIETIWNVLAWINNSQKRHDFIGEFNNNNIPICPIKIELFYHKTLTYQMFCYSKKSKMQKGLQRRMNELIPKQDKKMFGISN